MAGNKIRGITIEIAGDTSKLSESLRKVDDSLKSTQKQLSDVNRLLKLDPKNTELLRQKQELLNKAIDDSKKKVDDLKAAQAALGDRTENNAAQYDAIEREIFACEQAQAKWKSQLDGMTAPLKSFSDTMKDVSKTTGEWANKTKGVSMAAGAAAGGLLANAFAASASADDYNTLARNTGFTVEELQKMKYASDFVDVSFDSMTATVAKLTKNMASGSDAFDTLGVSITDSDGNLRDANDVWYDTLKALSTVENDTQRDALAMTLFGKSAMDLSGIIDDGGASLQEYGKQAEDAGLILSGDTMQAANQLNDQVDKLKATTTQAMLEAGAALATTLAPAIEKVVEFVTKLVTWFGELDGTTQAVILAILGVVAAISPLLSLISTITGVAAALSAVTLPMIGIMAGIVAGIALLVAAGVALYQNWDTVVAWAGTLRDNVVNAFDTIKSNVSGAIEGLKSTVSSVFENIRSTISQKIEDAKSIVTSAVDTIKGAFSFSWSLPPIKLPHISVKGGVAPYGIAGKGSLPSFDIQWYKKAYENAVIFRNPTVLPTLGGLKGFGDGNGSEMVIGTNKLLEMINKAGATDIDINIYAAQGMSETAIANAVAVRLDRWLGERL